jgi:hypothetical protein
MSKIFISVSMGHGAKAWVSDFNHPHYQAAKNAVIRVFNVEPDFTREGYFNFFNMFIINSLY